MSTEAAPSGLVCGRPMTGVHGCSRTFARVIGTGLSSGTVLGLGGPRVRGWALTPQPLDEPMTPAHQPLEGDHRRRSLLASRGPGGATPEGVKICRSTFSY